MPNARKEFIIRDNRGKTVLTIRLYDDKSRIFIDEEEFMTCRFVPISIPISNLKDYQDIESINDIIDSLDLSQEEGSGEEISQEVLPELDFFVNASNLQVWVELDYDTRVLDFQLSFPLLAKLSKRGDPYINQRFKEEILKGYYQGSEGSRTYLEHCGFLRNLTMDEFLSFPIERRSIREVSNFVLYQFSLAGDIKAKEEIVRRYNTGDNEMVKGLFEDRCIESLKGAERSNLFKKRDWEVISELERIMNREVTIRQNELRSDSYDGIRLKDGKIIEINLSLDEREKNIMPECLKKLDALEKLFFFMVDIEGVPDWIGKLTTLKYLDLHGLKIKEIPDSIGNLKKLKYLNLSYNQLEELPKSLENLTNLEKLVLYRNKFTIFSHSLRKLKKLQSLHLMGNPITFLPDWIGELISLRELELTGTKIQKIPQDFEELKELRKLNLPSTLLFLPSFLLDLPKIEHINLIGTSIQLDNELKNIACERKLSIYSDHGNIIKGQYYPD